VPLDSLALSCTAIGQLAIAISSCRGLNPAHNGSVDSESSPRERFIRFLRTIISFGQSLVSEDLDRAGEAAAAADLVIALGSSLSVYPAASIPLVAARRGVPYVIINRGPTGHDDLPEVTLRLDGDVTELFPPLVRAALVDA
jgi:NAD-dependent SIR2 family protein deacetylase